MLYYQRSHYFETPLNQFLSTGGGVNQWSWDQTKYLWEQNDRIGYKWSMLCTTNTSPWQIGDLNLNTIYPRVIKHGWLENPLWMEVLIQKSLINCPFSIVMLVITRWYIGFIYQRGIEPSFDGRHEGWSSKPLISLFAWCLPSGNLTYV